MSELIEVTKYPVEVVLKQLLKDKTTEKNIIYATDGYEKYGRQKENIITDEDVRQFSLIDIQPRVMKSFADQKLRTQKNAEVFTPTWIVNQMNKQLEIDGDWQKFVTQRVLEITCGEAPFLVNRYEATTGESIEFEKRIGILDKKLNLVDKHTQTEKEWFEWTTKAFESTYGYEFQGDNLLIARINLLVTFSEHLSNKFSRKATETELKKITNIITWNLWQMDGLNDSVPYSTQELGNLQLSFIEMEENENKEPIPCKIYNYRSKKVLSFRDLKGGNEKMKFDFIIGNPPYQQESNGANANDTPIYHYFYQESYKIADKVELITPARFLFDAGGTPKEWNKAMLNDTHLKVKAYFPKSSEIFKNTDIKGGVAIIYWDKDKIFEPVEIYTPYAELNSIRSKVWNNPSKSLSEIITNRGLYRYSDKAYKEQPDEMKKTADRRIAPSSFERMPKLFTENCPNDDNEYIQMYGNIKSTRVYRWFRKDYLEPVDNLYKYKVMIPKANGSGAIGEVLSTPLCGLPLCGFTETYISIGATDSKEEAEATLKYVKTKFARTMLGILKVTQNNAKPTWKYVPLQDFTENSDIDWSKSIHEIDLQLYRKYGLSQKEIDFIETHVKEME